jgi:CAAX protease family protein
MQRMRTLFINASNELRTGWRIVAMFLLLAAVVIGINKGWKAAGLPGAKTANSWQFLAIATLISGATFTVIVTLLRHLEKRGPDAIWMTFDRRTTRMLMLGTLLGAAPICLLMTSALVAGYGETHWANPSVSTLLGVMLPSIVTTFLLAGAEELVLRGYLLRQFSLGLNPKAAIIITGLLFGLMHGSNPGANTEGLLYTAVGGVLMAWLVFRFRSLWLMIGYHFGWNAAAGSVFGLEVSGFEDNAGLFVSTLTGADWLTGGSYGFEASLPAVILELLILAVVLFTSRSFGLRSVP